MRAFTCGGLPRAAIVACAALLLGGCGKVDSILEGKQPTTDRLYVTVPAAVVSVPQGGEQTLSATVTRIGDYTGSVAVTVEGQPGGVTATVGSTSTTGQTTSVPLTIHVDASVTPGVYSLKVRSHADPLPDGTATLQLNVTLPPSFTLSSPTSAITVIRGGVAPYALRITRTNVGSPVSLSVEGTPGIAATFGANPLLGDSTDALISVAAAVAPGAYTVSLRASAPGLVDRVMSLNVTVSPEALQLIAPIQIRGAQGSSVASDIILNSTDGRGAVTLATEGLPTGIAASFEPQSAGSVVPMRVAVASNVAAGSYPFVIRARSSGVADATAPVVLTVAAVAVSLSLDPARVTVLQVSSVTTSAVIGRTEYSGGVAIVAEGVPKGVTITPQPAIASGDSVSLRVVATSLADAGDYPVVIRATPVGFPVSASRTATLTVTVRATPPGNGNVLLDWSSCAEPAWVAWQDGAGPWTQTLLVSGAARFSVVSGKGAFAFVDGTRALTVRYMTQVELTTRPIDMCPPVPSTRSVSGTGVHASAGESFIYHLGGGTALSTSAVPAFTIDGVSDGPQDLVTWGTPILAGVRGLIRRDVDLPSGGTVGNVDLRGPESFTPLTRAVAAGGWQIGELVSHSVNYLTTPRCIVNALYGTPAFAGPNNTMFGVPEANQRPDDYHMLSVFAVTGARSRSTTMVFHSSAQKSVLLPSIVAPPTVSALPASVARLSANVGTVPAEYNGSVVLRYDDGANSSLVSATSSFSGLTDIVLTMPDLSGVSGWQPSFGVARNAKGNWSLALDGASSDGPMCAEGKRTVSITYSGSF